MKTVILCVLSVLLVLSLLIGCAAPAPAPTPTPKPAPAPAAKPPIKIGHIRSLTGPTAITNAAMVQGFNMGMELAKYEVAGRKIEVILEDDAIKPELALDKARKLVEQDKVDMIVGPTLAGLQLAVATYCNKVGMPNINTNTSLYAIVAQKLGTIQTGGTQAQTPSCNAKYAMEKQGIKKLSIIGEDSAAGRDYVGNFATPFKKAGGEIVQEQWVPQNTGDYAPYFAAAKASDGVLAWTSGNDSVKFLNQYYDFGMWDKMPLVPAFQGAIIESFILGQLQPKAADACLKIVTGTSYTPLFDNAANKIFVENYKAKNKGAYPDTANASAYIGALVIVDALKATNGDTTPQKFIDAMLASTALCPDGPAKFDKAKRSAIKDIAIIQVQKIGNEYLLSAPIFTYKDVPPEGL